LSIDSKLLLNLRHGKGLSRLAVAKALDVSDTAIRKIETNPDSNPTARIIKGLAELYNVSTDVILGRETVK
jgi:transcriptional regulator with XRE-family HTH domain